MIGSHRSRMLWSPLVDRLLAVALLVAALAALPLPAHGQTSTALPPAIAVSRTVTPSTTGAVQNNRITVTYVVANRQARPLTGILLATTLRPGISVTSASPLPDRKAGELAWSLGTLAPFASTTVQLTVTVPNPIPVQIDDGARAFATLDARAVSASSTAATLRSGAVDEALLRSTLDAETTDPFILTKAAELGYDVTRIFTFVRDEIGYHAYQGSLRGARGTLWNKAGNALDRASLLVALLRASGVPARYVRGTLPDGLARQLIASMFPPALRTVALVPPGTQVADPVNDPKLLLDARDHFWVELDAGGGFQPADPSFASAQIGQVFTTATDTFAEVPDELRHKVVVRLMRELTSQATALFGVPGQDLSPVIDQVVRTVEVVGRPLSIGHIVESTGIGAIFSVITNTYSPYMIVGKNALDPSRDGVIRGQDYQEVLTNFPLGNQILTGLFLELDVVAPDGSTRHYRRTVADRIGIAARRHGGTGAATINPQAPFLVSPFDITTINIMPSPFDESVLPSVTAQMAVLQAAALEFQAQVAATSPGPAQTLFAPRANDVMRDGLVAMGRARLIEFASLSDEFSAGMARSTKVVAYFDSPRISIFQTRAQFSPDGLLSFSFAIDLRKNDIRALAAPGQNAAVPISFNLIRGYTDTKFETLAVGTPPQVDGLEPRTPLSAHRIFELVAAQGVETVVITAANVAQLDALDIPADAKVLIADAVLQDRMALVPVRGFDIDGRQRVGWYESDLTTGDTIGVMDDGGHQSSVDSAATKAFETYLARANDFALGMLVGMQTTTFAKAIVFILGMAVSAACEQSPQSVGFLTCKVLAWKNAISIVKQFLEDSKRKVPPRTAFQAGYVLGVTIGQNFSNDPPLSGYAFDPTPPVAPQPDIAQAEVPVAATATAGAVQGSITSASTAVTGQMQAAWSTTGTSSFVASSMTIANGSVLDGNGAPVGTGAISLLAPAGVGVETTTETIGVQGSGDLGFYAPATTDLGVGGRWESYTATLSGTTSLRVTTAGLAINGTPLPSGTYTITTTAATLTGFGPSTSPTFAGTAGVNVTAGVVSVGPGSGTLTVGGAALPLTTGFTLGGFTGAIDVTAGASVDTVALDGTAEHVLRVSASPAAVSANRSTPGSTTVSVFTSLADAYIVDVEAPDEWTATIDTNGAISITPAAGLSSGIVPIRLTARSKSRPELVAQADLVVTVGATAPAVIVRVDPDPLFTVPFAGAQVPSAFRAVMRNLGPTDTFALTFPTVPAGFTMLATETQIQIPAGETAEVGVYLQPVGQLPAPGTPAGFSVQVTSVNNPAVTASDTEAFILPEVHGVLVSVTPDAFGAPPGSPVSSTLALTAVGNVAEQVALTASTPSGLTLQGLTSSVVLAPGQSVEQELTLTSDGTVPLNSLLTADITASFGPLPFTETVQVAVQVVVPSAQSAIDASLAARGAGQGAVADALRDLGLAITDLFGAPGDAVLRARVLADIDRLIERLVDPAFAALVTQLQNVRASIASGTAQSLPGDLATLDSVLNEVGNVTVAAGRHRFAARLEPNRQVASPQVPVSFQLSVQNLGTETTTYQLTVEGLPGNVTSQLSAPTVTLAPGEASANLGLTLTQTSATALTAVGFDVRITPTLASELSQRLSGALTARAEIVSVVNVSATPPFAPAGTVRALAARLLNAVNQVRQASIDFVVKDANGTVVHQASSPSFELGVLASLVTVDLGTVDTTGFVNGTFTVDVVVKNAGGAAIPGATGTGTFMVGTPVTASIAVTPEIVPAGTRTVSTTLRIDSQVPLSNQFAQIAQVPGAAHTVALKGTVGYFCGPNGIQIVDVSDPENPVVQGTFGQGEIVNSGLTACKVSGDLLIVRTQVNGNITLQVRVYSIANPTAPQLLSATPATADYFFAVDLVLAGSTVLTPTQGFCFFFANHDVFEHHGDLAAFDITNPAAPAFAGVIFNGPIRNLSGCLARGGPNNNWQSVLADPTTLLMGSTTVQGTDAHAGVGRIRVVDIANPAQMSIVAAGELQIPGTVHVMSLAKDGTVGLALGSTGGWGDFQQDLGMTGNIVVATVDLTNPRQPALIATRELNRLARGLNRVEALGNGRFIASSLGGVNDPPQALLIDASDPQNPIVSQVDLPIDTIIAAVDGDIIYGTSAAGFSIFRLGAVGVIPVTAQVQIPKGTGVTIVPNSFNQDPDEIVAGAQFDTLVWRRGLNAGALSLTFTWLEQVANVQPGEAREVTLNTTVDFESVGTEGRIPLGPLAVLAEQVIALAPATRTVRPGEVASYTVIMKNPSTSTVEYDLTVEGVAPELVTILSHVTVPAGSTQQLSLTLRTEPLAALGEYGFAVNAHALGIEASVLGSVVLAGEPVVPDGDVRGVVASLTPGQATAGQGTAATFTLRVTNVGSLEDTYVIGVNAPNGFTTSATPNVVTVPPGVGNFTEVQITVVPPPGTPVGDVGITATVTSIPDPAVFAEASGLVSVTAVGVTVALDPPVGAPSSAFQMTVTNTGMVAQTFDLSLGGPAAVASTLGASSVTLAPGASQVVSVNVGAITFATPGSLDLTGAATARTNTAVKASATARVTIGDTAGVTASFDPALVVLPTPGGAAFLLQVKSTGNKEDTYKATVLGSSGPITASLVDLAGVATQNVPLFRMPGLGGAALVLNATLQAPGQGTVTVRVQSLTDPTVVADATATVQSQSSNAAPTADAGDDQEVPFGTTIALDGSSSHDPDGAPQPLTFAWTFVSVPSGSTLDDPQIDGAATANPSFEPDVRGDYLLRLTVNDGATSATDEVLVSVVNNVPVAVAGRDRNVATGAPAALDGSDSFDLDGDLITYQWSFQSVAAGSGLTNAAITGPTKPDPSFVPDVAGTYVLKLVVRDPEAASDPSLVTVRAFAGNIPPIAHAGPDRHVAANVSAALDGRASVDPDAGPGALTFAWTVVGVPAGSLITTGSLSGADQAQPSLTPDIAGDYRIALRVGDGEAFSDDEVIITAQVENVAPNANAGSNVVATAGAALTLDGSTSVDPDGGPAPLTYRWRFVSVPPGSSVNNSQIGDADKVQSRFTPDVIGSYVLELTVFDGAAGDFDNVLVVVQAPDVPTCFGRPATIFVRDGVIVGGPDHGKPYRLQLHGTRGDDVIVGTPGADRISGNGGNDVICGGDGDDTIEGGPGHDMIDGGPGNDRIKSHGGNDVVLGGDGDDIIEGADGDDEIDGGIGNDRIKGMGGHDTLRGGDGNDNLEGGAGNDVMQGGKGKDSIEGQAGDDVIEGGPDDDKINGGPGRDECRDEGTNVKDCEIRP